MYKQTIAIILLIGILLFSFSCEDDPTGSDIGELYIIEVNPPSLNIEIDSIKQFNAVGRDADMNIIGDLVFSWTSRYPNVATVDENGVLAALSSGTTFITAESGTIESLESTVTVYDPVFSIEILEDSLSVNVDSTTQFAALGKDMNGDDIIGLQFQWETGDASIAIVDNQGTVTGISEGNTFISAKLREIESLPSTINVVQWVGTVVDIDGNIYTTVKIGTQWWMAENLNVIHYRDGSATEKVTDQIEWSGLSFGAYCDYENNAEYSHIYGKIYNGFVVADSRNVAPEGWHVPTDEDWKQLEIFLGMSETAVDEWDYRGTNEGGKLKEEDTLHWDAPNTGATNESGFRALPSGFRWLGTDWAFGGMGNTARFWTSTEFSTIDLWDRSLVSNSGGISRRPKNKIEGYSIRCVKD